MSLKSVLSNLNNSYNSFTPTRNMSVTGALVESLKFNLRFRFSVLGMITALTKSSTLYNVAQQRYIDRKDADRIKEDLSFKGNVASSVSALARQVDLLQSVVEKNSYMINMMVNDLGYFKRQKRINFFGGNTLQLKNSSMRIPLNSSTVKGRIEQINSELEKLRKSGIGKKGVKDGGDGLKDLANSKLLKDLTKVAAAGGIGAALAGLAAQNAGGSQTTQQIMTILGGILGAASIPATSKIIEYILKASVPILGKIAKLSFAVSMAPTALNIVSNSFERTINRASGKVEQNPYEPGSAEYELFEMKRTAQQIGDTALQAAVVGFAANALLKIPGSKGSKFLSNFIRTKSIQRKLRTAQSQNPLAERIKRKQAFANDRFQNRYTNTARSKGARAAKMQYGPGTMYDPYEEYRSQRGKSAQTRRMIRQGATTKPSIISRVAGAVQSRVGGGNVLQGQKRVKKILDYLKTSKTLRRIPVASVAYAIIEFNNIANNMEDLSAGRIGYTEYKENVTNALTRVVNTVGVSALFGILGAAVGTAFLPGAGTLAGGLLAFTGGMIASTYASLALSESGGDSWVAEKLFGALFENENLENSLSSAVTTTAATAQPIEADLAAFNKVQKFEGADQIDGGVETILATIRQKESGNDYSADLLKDPKAQERARKAGYAKASASGAYQFVDGTWQGLTKKYNIGTQYQRAVDAPPAVQDMVAAAYVNEVLIATDGDVSKVPVAWYTGNIRGELSAQQLAMNTGLTVEKYQASWLDAYRKQGGASGALMASSDQLNALRNNLASQNSAEADQAMMKYFMSLGTIAQVLPTATETTTETESSVEDVVARTEARAGIEVGRGAMSATVSVAEGLNTLERKFDLLQGSNFPHVRPA
jgi:hypothetical protein